MSSNPSPRARLDVTALLTGGLAAGILSALVASLIAAAAGLAERPSLPMTFTHIAVASLITNVLGAALLAWLRRRTARATAVYAVVAVAVATASSIEVMFRAPAELVALATVLHYAVAALSAASLPWLFPAEPSGVPLSGIARALIAFPVVITAASPLLADFNTSHLFNPAWPPHARYHGMLLITLSVAIGLAAHALLWRPSPPQEQRLRVAIAAAVPVLTWCCFLVALVVPEVSSWPDGFIHRLPVNMNIVLAALQIALASAGWQLARRGAQA